MANLFKNKFLYAGLLLAGLVVAGVFYFKSKSSLEEKSKFNPAFSAYISAFTSGNISIESSIKIEFTTDIVSQEAVNQEINENLFNFSPSVNGKATWINRHTIEFKTEKNLPFNTQFSAQFLIEKVLQMPKNLKTFDFQFATLSQNYEVEISGIYYVDNQLDKMVLKGNIQTFEPAENLQVEKMISCANEVRWTHENSRKHFWEIVGIKRENTNLIYKILFKGKEIESDTDIEKTYEIPQAQKFEVLETQVFQGEEQYVKIVFSEPLERTQNFEGIITLGDLPQFRTLVESNFLYIYPPVKQSGTLQLTVNEGIKNVANKNLSKIFTKSILFEEQKPAIRLIGKGMIVPSSNGLIFPFEAVNVKAVEVIILKVHGQNITQFFQTNSYGDKYGPSELRKVGKRVLHKLIPITQTNTADYNNWKRYDLDLSELIKAEPSAIFQVMVSFKQNHTTYSCEGKPDYSPILAQNLSSEEEITEHNNSFEGYDYYDSYYPDNYNYDDRDNPCTVSYYTSSNTSQSSLIYHSDIGMIAKKNKAGDLTVFTTDLIKAEPIKGAEIELYDYQNMLIQSGTTDADGKFEFNSKARPFVVIAKKDNQKSYLKLDDGSSLANTYFEVSGAEIQKGIKSYIYGERGVWRPGDSLYLTFVLEDKLNKIPEHYPVTLDFSNPQGQIVSHKVHTNDINGVYVFGLKTDISAPTGHWQASFKIGGATFTKDIRIETILPNRLKINLDFDKKIILSNDENLQANLKVMWLHGAVGSNLITKIDAIYSSSNTSFKGFEKFDFQDASSNYYSEPQQVFEQKTDDNGEGNFYLKINKENQPSGIMTILLKVKTFEEGGAASTFSTSIPYSPFASYVGLAVPKSTNERAFIYETNLAQTLEIANVLENGLPVISGNVNVNIYKLDWQWWYENVNNNLYIDFNSATPSHSFNTKINNGKGTIKLTIENENWGRYLVQIKDKSGHICSKIIYFDWPGYGASSNTGGTSIITVSTDKKKYNVGEKIQLSIPSSGIGKALITLESGSKVLKSEWINTNIGLTTYTFEALPEYAPNLFAYVTVLQPHAQVKNDLPIRMYGIAPIEIENKENILTPIISTSESYRPLENCTISIKEQLGKAMTYTLAVVDEGLLDITRFITPNPYSTFYAKEALGITTWDLYDYVMGSTAGQISRNLSIGGDEGLKKGNETPLNRFRPVVKFLGPFELEKGSENKHTFTMPNYVGSVKVMVVGSQNGSYGNAEKAVPVRKPLMLLATLPRVCGPEEEISLPVNIFAMDKKIKNVSISVQTSGVISVKDADNQTINLNGAATALAWFQLKVKPQTGQGRVKITATSAGETASYDVLIESRNANIEQTQVYEKVLEAGQELTKNMVPFGMKSSNSLALEVSNMPAINLESRLKYLLNYPYGCVEQTTSAVFPQLVLHKFIELNESQKNTIQKNINAGIQRLIGFQTSDGGLGYWQGDDVSNEWGTNYAAHFIIQAEKNGYVISNSFKTNILKYLQKMARNWQPKNRLNYYSEDQVQAYRLYILALAGKDEQGAMNRLKEYPKLSLQSAWRLAGAYTLIGQNEMAHNLISKLNYNSTYTQNEQFNNTYYGSEIRDKAMILEVMTEMDDKTKTLELSKIVASNLASQSYLNTQEIAFSLLAMSKISDLFDKKDDLKFNYNFANAKSILAQTALPISQIKLDGETNGNLYIKNTSKSVQYIRIIQSGIPLNGAEKSFSNNLILNISYTLKNGKPLDVSELKQGTSFVAQVTVKHPGIFPNYDNLALKQVFPSGWEISNPRFEYENAPILNQKSFDYQDVRDDRIFTFFSLRNSESKTFSVQLTASYIGKYYLPLQLCESMYQGEVGASLAGKWVKVIEK